MHTKKRERTKICRSARANTRRNGIQFVFFLYICVLKSRGRPSHTHCQFSCGGVRYRALRVVIVLSGHMTHWDVESWVSTRTAVRVQQPTTATLTLTTLFRWVKTLSTCGLKRHPGASFAHPRGCLCVSPFTRALGAPVLARAGLGFPISLSRRYYINGMGFVSAPRLALAPIASQKYEIFRARFHREQVFAVRLRPRDMRRAREHAVRGRREERGLFSLSLMGSTIAPSCVLCKSDFDLNPRGSSAKSWPRLKSSEG